MEKIIQIIDVTYKMITTFMCIHSTKRTYNDLKFDNIMVNTGASLDADPQVFLIDYGFSDKYFKKEAKEHIDESDTRVEFRGNMMFASERQMASLKTSRKDDLISLFYLLICMLLNDRNLWKSSEDDP